MKKKYEILNFNLKELDLLERHLNKMAKNHWHLKWISNYILCFEYNDNEIHYYIDYNQFSFYDKKKEENQKEENSQISFYEDLGYRFLCSFDNYVIYKSDTQLEKIHTNDEIKEEFLKHVKNRTTKYNLLVLLSYIVFLFLYFYFNPKEALLSFFDLSYPILCISILISIYFTIHNQVSNRKFVLKDIKYRTIIHLTLQLTECIMLYLFVIISASKIETLGILIGYICIYKISNLLYFKSTEKQYKYIPFITNQLPYIIIAIILIIGLFNNDNLDIHVPYNENFPQNIINTDFFIDNPHVEHYNENESIALHMIESRIVNYEEDEAVNIFYYEDKTTLLKPLILFYYDALSPDEIKIINDIEIRFIRNTSYGMTYLTLTKDSQYVYICISEEYEEDTINHLIGAINWEK